MITNQVASAAQCRAARALLGWTQGELAQHAGVARKTVADFEAGVRQLRLRTRHDITRTLEIAGVEFTAIGAAEGVNVLRQAPAAPAMAKPNGAAGGASPWFQRSQT
jgi:DNA-binding XRE family transcriptional regulator